MSGESRTLLHDQRFALPDSDLLDAGGQLERIVHADAGRVLSSLGVVREQLLKQGLGNEMPEICADSSWKRPTPFCVISMPDAVSGSWPVM